MKNKKLLAALFMIIVCVASICFMSISANAAVSVIDTISEGETWRESWSANVSYQTVNLEVDKTALYDFTVHDYKGNGIFSINLNETTLGYSVHIGTIYTMEPVESHKSQSFLLVEGHTYELVCYYEDTNGNHLNADMSIVFNERTDEVIALPNCNLTSSRLNATFVDGDRTIWLSFTPSVSGDYSFDFETLYASVYVYDKVTGDAIYVAEQTEYWDSINSDLMMRDSLVFTLEENKEYYFRIVSYENGSTKLSITKNDKDVVNIAPYEQRYTINSFTKSWNINQSYFSYILTYSDNTTLTVYNYREIFWNGYSCPSPVYAGERVWINDDYYLKAGEQPVETTYNGVTTTTYIYVQSLTEYFSYLNVTNEDVHRTIEYEGDDYYQYYWRVNVSNSGWYGIYRYNTDDFGTNFDTYSITIVDDQNNVIEFNDDFRAWNLTANEEYVLCFYYQYDPDYSYNDITFWLQKQNVAEGWTNEDGKWAYYENGVKLTNQWKKDNTGWCYLGADGYMLTNKWVKDSKGWCYVGANGYMVYNKWVKDSIGWCHVGANGYMEYNKWVKDSIGWCHVGANGYMEYNKWIKDSTGWCHVGANGYMEYNKWVKDSIGWCHVGANGYMEYNKWVKDSTGWCYVGSTGYMVTNAWVSSGGQWYYMNASGYMVTGRQLIGGKYYTFNSSGVWVG